jgi:hypothetical protein
VSPVIKYDVSDVPETANAPVGMYRAKIQNAEEGTSKSSDAPMVTITFQLTHHADGSKVTDDYWPVRQYLMIEDERPYARRAIKEFVEALGMKTKGGLDLKKIIGKQVQLRLKEDTDQNGDYSPRIGKILPAASSDAEPEEPEEDGGGEEESVDLSTLDRDGLKALIKSEGLGSLKDLGITKSTSDDDIRALIADKLGLSEESEPEGDAESEPEEEEEAEDGGEGDGYDSMSVADLKKEVAERELPMPKGSGLKPKLIKALRDDDGSSPF